MEQLKGFTLSDLNKLLQQKSYDEFETWLRQLGLLHTSRLCVCGKEMTLAKKKYKNAMVQPPWICNKKMHAGKPMKKGFYSGTFLSYQSSARTHPKKIFRFIYYWCWDLLDQYDNLDSGLKLQGKQTVQDWMNFCRAVCVQWYRKNSSPTNNDADNKIDEIDLWKKQFAGPDIFYHFWSQVAQMYPLQQQQKDLDALYENGADENETKNIKIEEIDHQEPQQLLQPQNSVVDSGENSNPEQWRFFSQVSNEEHLRRICRKLGLVGQNSSSNDDPTAFYKCQIAGTGRMVDTSGKVWHFLTGIQDEAQLPLICLQNELARWAACSTRRYYICKRADQYPSRKRGLPHCPLRAIYHKDKGCLYVDGQHNHPILTPTTSMAAVANNNE